MHIATMTPKTAQHRAQTLQNAEPCIYNGS